LIGTPETNVRLITAQNKEKQKQKHREVG
jgi:hypothetical protein